MAFFWTFYVFGSVFTGLSDLVYTFTFYSELFTCLVLDLSEPENKRFTHLLRIIKCFVVFVVVAVLTELASR